MVKLISLSINSLVGQLDKKITENSRKDDTNDVAQKRSADEADLLPTYILWLIIHVNVIYSLTLLSSRPSCGLNESCKKSETHSLFNQAGQDVS